MQGNCLQAGVVYKADITTTDNNETKTYIAVTANEFNTRFRKHTKSINSKKYQNENELSKYIWHLGPVVHIRELPFFAQKLAALRGVERYMAELKRINMS